jgi:hypothetical protein
VSPGIATTFLLATVGYVILTSFAMWPAVSDISNTIMGPHQPSDATSGGIWLAYQFAHTSIGAGTTSSLGSPAHGNLWNPTFLTALAWVLPLWVLAHLVSPVAAWNLIVLLGFLLDGLLMFALVFWLTRIRWISFVAGVLFAFSPYGAVQSHIHVGYVYDWVYPAALWAGLAWVRSPTRKHAVVFGLAIGLAAYVDGYFVVFLPIVGAIVAILALALAPLIPRDRIKLLRTLPVAAATALVCEAPLAILVKLGSGAVSVGLSVDRTRNAVDTGSATLAQYFVPFRTSPPWHNLLTAIFGASVSLPDVTGPCLYLGTVSLLVIVVALVAVARTRSVTENWQLPAAFILPLAGLAAVVVILVSLATIGPMPGFPRLLWSVEPFWRAFARLGEAAISLVALGAAVGLALLTTPKYRRLAPLVACLAVLDGTYILPWASWSYSTHTPPAVAWLAAHPDGGAVAAYPLVPPPLPPYEYDISFQVIDHHPLFNGAPTASAHGRLERGLSEITDPQTVPTLRREDVRYVMVSPAQYLLSSWPSHSVPGLTPVITNGGVILFRVAPGPRAAAALAIGNGFDLERQFLPGVERWMAGRTATLDIERFAKSAKLTVSFQALSYKSVRHLNVTQSGSILWHGSISPGGTAVRFRTESTAPLHLVSSPGGVHIRGWLTTRSLNITMLDITPSKS